MAQFDENLDNGVFIVWGAFSNARGGLKLLVSNKASSTGVVIPRAFKGCKRLFLT